MIGIHPQNRASAYVQAGIKLGWHVTVVGKPGDLVRTPHGYVEIQEGQSAVTFPEGQTPKDFLRIADQAFWLSDHTICRRI